MEKNERTRILYITTTDRIAGAEKQILEILRMLDRTRFEARLVILKKDAGGELMQKAEALGIAVEYIGIQSHWQVFRLWKLWRILKTYEPAIFESFLFFDNQVARILGKIAGVPIVISGQRSTEGGRRTRLRAFVDKLTMRLADFLIANSNDGRQWYVNNGYIAETQTATIYNSMDMTKLADAQTKYPKRIDGTRELFGVPIPKGEYAIGTICFLRNLKGLTYLIEAAVQLHDLPLHFFIIGEGEMKDELLLQAQKLGIANRIHLVGAKEYAAQYMHLFDMHVLPSLVEGLPNVVIEAMASRTISIATTVGGTSELIQNGVTGFLVPPADTHALASAIRRAVALNTEEKDAMAAKAYQFVSEHLAPQVVIKQREMLYEKLIREYSLKHNRSV